MNEQLARRFRDALPTGVYCSARFFDRAEETLTVRSDVPEPVHRSRDTGVMVTVVDGRGAGYAATSDLSTAGLREAVSAARDWAAATAELALFDASAVPREGRSGSYSTPVEQPADTVPLTERLDRLRGACAQLAVDPRIVDRSASLWQSRTETLYLDSLGAEIHQDVAMLSPDMRAVAHADGQTQVRSLGSRGETRAGGLEILDRVDFDARARGIAEEAIELLLAPDCPSGVMDLVLAPDQMVLQIHESIGHPLELDRILGDERNYAGTSFVSPDMFGSYRYGSPLLNVTFDPGRPDQLASYGFDDDGTRAERTWLIRDGILERPIGSLASQSRAGLPGLAAARATSWNRPPIDRMANINVEPGESSEEALVAGVERGVLMQTNVSWSIDDSRNKFQFGCERGRLIVDGELREVVRNPNYRGVSATFWRSLSGVGNAGTVGVLGTPFCGKGEPNQVIRVGHASPTCRFSDVDVFGGG